MANLLGDIWVAGAGAKGADPDWVSAIAMPDVKLHLYGKIEPRPGRKMGHLTATAETPAAAAKLVRAARARLLPPVAELS
jgi:5-(carboxyamino)imidazole ribonucleotide synthase